ncbi:MULTISPECIES: AraC family transcriptional regulator [Caballeronia]|uniref:AraC family transcriptional regulator n=1 Tax=Caballeronia TaxID=1827195 RepID=UPI001FD394C5|nr:MULTISPECIES: AraC family transcriptional regulator [Caballeronia]MDR5799151.1 AraC family transcriptional regulator ligand-binding domain-containing protein [Caballeronia sp. LZ001]
MQRFELSLNAPFAASQLAEVAVVTDVARKLGVSPLCVLDRTGITLGSLEGSEQRLVSMDQFIGALTNGVERTHDRCFTVRAGSRVHLSAFGLAGYALWSAASLRAALELASRYKPLLNLKCGPTLSVEDEVANLYFSAPQGLTQDEADMCLEFEVAKVLTFIADLQVQAFDPEIHIASSSLPIKGTSLMLMERPVHCSEGVTKIVFKSSLLDQPLVQFNPVTNKACIRSCDETLLNFDSSTDLVSRVRTILCDASLGAIPTLPEVASQLCMSARTLRRRLETMETSYSEILDGVRRSLAIRYVSTTQMTTECIAERLNYSDAANFSHAFKRWTGHAPRAYRTRAVTEQQTIHSRHSPPELLASAVA